MNRKNQLKARNEKFVLLFIDKPHELRTIQETLGITKQEAKRLRKIYFGIYFSRYRIFEKLISKQDLTLFELQYILRCSLSTVKNYKKQYNRGIRVQNDIKGKIL